jgi:hypothetical protein
MVKTTDEIDLRLRKAIDEALAESKTTKAERARLAELLHVRLVAEAGGAAQRRRSLADIKAAFREGFFVGKDQGRLARWHAAIWAHSAIARRLKEQTLTTNGGSERYARYNY